jgi:hypothetical protein
MGIVDWIKNRGKEAPDASQQRNESKREPELAGAAPNDKGQIKPIWESGLTQGHLIHGRSEEGALLTADYTVSAQGVMGESRKGFHHRLDLRFQFTHADEERGYELVDRKPGIWSEPVPTKDTASREIKTAMMAFDRERPESERAGKQSVAAVNEAIKNGRHLDQPIDSRNEIESSEKENGLQIRAQTNYRDR